MIDYLAYLCTIMFMPNHPLYNYIEKRMEYFSVFKEGNNIPLNLPIKAVWSIPILNSKVLMVKNVGDDLWGVPGGCVEIGEDWKDVIVKVIAKDVGITADNHRIIGYFEISSKTVPGNNMEYPSRGIVLVTLSFVQKYIPHWARSIDVSDRAMVSFKNIYKYIDKRKDFKQLTEVLCCAKEILDKLGVAYDFSFIKGDVDSCLPVTQVYGFCKDVDSGGFCLVRETGQDHYGLPGGGCEIGELPEEAFRRELNEETLFTAEAVNLIGFTRIDMFASDKKIHLQTIFQARYYTEIKEKTPFVANKNGFEIEERIFVPFSNLIEKVAWLKTDVGKLVLDEVSKIK